MAAEQILEERAATATPHADDVTSPMSGPRSSGTLDLQRDDIIHVEGVAHMVTGSATVIHVNRRPAPAGGHYVTTSRGTFLAAADQRHLVLTPLGPGLAVSSWDGEGGPASAGAHPAKAPRSVAIFATAAAACGYDLDVEADAAAARHSSKVWDLVWAEISR